MSRKIPKTRERGRISVLIFITIVLLLNLAFVCFTYSIRHTIGITTPVIVMTALAAFLCTIAFPYMLNIMDYTQLVVTFCAVILFFSVLLTLADKKFPAPELRTTGTNQPGKAEQKSEPDTGNEITTATMTADVTGREQPAQEAVSMIHAEAKQIPSVVLPPPSPPNTKIYAEVEQLPTSTSTTELKPAAAQDQVTTPPQDALIIHPVPELSDSFPDKEEEDIEAPGNPEMNGYVELPEQKQDEQPPAVETETEAEAETEAETEPKPAAVAFAPKENKPPPPETNHLPGTSTEGAIPNPDRIGVNLTDLSLNKLIELGFSSKQNGDYLEAAITFFRALQKQPEPKLAILLLIEISDIYREAGQFWQAAEILNILLKNRRDEMSMEKIEKIEQKINQLHALLNKRG